MEYIKSSSTNLDKYIDEFHSEVKETFANSLTKIYKAEINVYRDLIETVVKLPFIQEIIHENNMLKSKLKQMTEENDTIKLEIHDKPLIKTDIVDIENIPFTTEVSSEEEDDEESSTDEEEEPSADQDEEEEEPSADQDEEEPSADQEEEEPSADEEETEVFEIEIDDKTYYCDGEENGNIYEDMNGEVGDIVGEIKDGEANFF